MEGNSAIDNRCCQVCRQIRPDRYLLCPGLAECRMYQAYHDGLMGNDPKTGVHLRNDRELHALFRENDAIRGE